MTPPAGPETRTTVVTSENGVFAGYRIWVGKKTCTDNNCIERDDVISQEQPNPQTKIRSAVWARFRFFFLLGLGWPWDV